MPARRWFAAAVSSGWASTPITETGVVRLAMNPAVVRPPLSAIDAVSALEALRAAGDHAFWPDEVVVGADGVDWSRVLTHRQVTDARLVAIAAAHDGHVVTFDAGLARRHPERTVLLDPA